MYQPPAFLEDSTSRLHDLIEAHTFGTLIVASDTGALEIAHLPFVLDRAAGAHGRLLLHVARANPIWTAALAAPLVTAIFTGPHGYISPAWYENPSEAVPTWNYAVVHAHGPAEALDRGSLSTLLDQLVVANERDSSGGWHRGQLVPALHDPLLDAIVGLSIAITTLEGKLKLSQNRTASDRARVVAALRERGRPDDLAMIELMTRL